MSKEEKIALRERIFSNLKSTFFPRKTKVIQKKPLPIPPVSPYRCVDCGYVGDDFYQGSCGVSRRCAPCSRRLSKKYYKKDPDSRHSKSLMRRFGITLEEYNLMCKEQGFVCACCGQPERAVNRRSGSLKPGTKKRLAVDHDHTMIGRGSVRGLLCSCCNQALGCMSSNPLLIVKLLRYCLKWDRIMKRRRGESIR